jgi:hypothetical protein
VEVVDNHPNLGGLYFRLFTTDRAYLMTVTVIVVASLILRGALKSVSCHKSQFQKEVQRII